MKLELEKCTRIISDLVMFCHSMGAEEYHVDLFFEDGAFQIDIFCPLLTADPRLLGELSECLNLPRQHEIEQSYWELSGDSEIESELTLVGMMLDSATVVHNDGLLHISACRKI